MAKSRSGGGGKSSSRKSRKVKAAVRQLRANSGVASIAALAAAAAIAEQTLASPQNSNDAQDAAREAKDRAAENAALAAQPDVAAAQFPAEAAAETNDGTELPSAEDAAGANMRAESAGSVEEGAASGESDGAGEQLAGSGDAGIASDRIELADASSSNDKNDKSGSAAGTETKGGAAAEGAAGSGEASGLSEMGVAPIAIAAVGLAAAAAGGGGGGGGAVGAVVTPGPGAAGFAAKGPLSGAKVGYDLNGNGVLDSNEVLATTDASGNYQFPAGTTAPAGVKLLASGGSYTDKAGQPVSFTGTLAAPAGGAAITPYSSLAAAGISASVLSEMLGGRDWNSLTASDFAATSNIEAVGLAIFEQLNAGASINEVIAALTAGAPSLDLSDPTAAMSVLTLAASGNTPVAGDIAKINAGLPFGATAVFDPVTGAFDHYAINESDLSLLGGVDQFGADDLWVNVEGTLLGSAASPVTFAQLNALGVDKVAADGLAPYLHLTTGNSAQTPGFTIDASGAANGVVATLSDMSVGGTDLGNDNLMDSALGVNVQSVTDSQLSGYMNSVNWDDPLNLVDDHD